MLVFALPAGADAAEPGDARAAASGAVQAQDSVRRPSIPTFSFESSSAALPAAAQREMGNTILRKIQSDAAVAARVPDASIESTSAPNGPPASSSPPSSPEPTGDAASGAQLPDAPAAKAPGEERSASPAPGESPPVWVPTSVVTDTSGGFKQDPGTRPRPHGSSDRTGSLKKTLPVAVADTTSRLARTGYSTPAPQPGHQVPWPPKDPAGALTAALGGSSSTLFGIFMAALVGLMANGAFRAPTRRAASPSDRLVLAPAFSRLERPG